MSKAILVLQNNPKKCAECQLRCSYENHLFCFMTSKDLSNDEYYNKKPDWCPLKPIPKKKDICGIYNNEYYANGGMSPSEKFGYNTCIDEILGN